LPDTARNPQVKLKVPTKEVFKHITSIPNALLGLLAISMGHLIMVAVMVMTPVHMAHVDVSLNIIGFVISVHIAGMYALSPVVGYLTDRLGRQQVILIGSLILIASAVISGLSPANNEIQLGIGLFLLRPWLVLHPYCWFDFVIRISFRSLSRASPRNI
jgi:MFS family permease